MAGNEQDGQRLVDLQQKLYMAGKLAKQQHRRPKLGW
jgi:hypothetical protein